jgi:hypothetical protein
MAGTIIISKHSVLDLRTIDFEWLAGELRLKIGKTAAVIAKVLWPHDEGGMDVIQADNLDEAEFKMFAQVIREIYNSLAKTGTSLEMVRFLASLLQSIEEDARYS